MRTLQLPAILTSTSLRSPSSLHDLFILSAVMLAALVFALEYDILQTADAMTPHERKISLAEAFALTGILMIGLIVFSARRIREQRIEFERRLAAEREAFEARSQANSDSLTGLPNRRALNAKLDKFIKNTPAAHAVYALMLLDLNRFKAINDGFGHPVGDKVLERIGQRLKAVVDENHFAARLGGDEFAVFCPLAKSRADILRSAEKIAAAIEEPIVLDGTTHGVGAAIGIAFFPQDAQSRLELMRRADRALYRAKETGRSAIRCYA